MFVDEDAYGGQAHIPTLMCRHCHRGALPNIILVTLNTWCIFIRVYFSTFVKLNYATTRAGGGKNARRAVCFFGQI